jgi:simple sugar transport system ATP-binding protein
MTCVLDMRRVSKSYHGVFAIRDVDFTLEEAEVHALIGENGAGKSTLTKIVAGVLQPTAGDLFVREHRVVFANPAAAQRAGIAMVFQETSLVPSMSVAQNLFLGEEKFLNRLRGIQIAAQQLLRSLNFPVDPSANVGTLGAAHKQMVEIARAVRQSARIIIFDEPTATLTPEEKRHFFSLIARLKESGVSIVFITHALEEALYLSDRITILRDGVRVITDRTSTFNRERIIRFMIGRSSTADNVEPSYKRRRARSATERVLTVQDLRMGNVVCNNSFSIYAGQITGIFGLVGSGRTETAKIIAGIEKRDFSRGGEIQFMGLPVRFRVPRAAMKRGIVYVTEDRKLEGFFENQSVAENLYSGLLAAGLEKSLFLTPGEMRALAAQWIRRLNIKAIGSGARVVELSGGNQQKVVVGKALVQRPRLIIFDEPTRGVDVGSIVELHELLNGLAEEGLAVVVISSYLPEILSLSDRILVCRQGRIVEEFASEEATDERVMYAAVH